MARVILVVIFVFLFSYSLQAQKPDNAEFADEEKWLRDSFLKLYNSSEGFYPDSLNNEIIARFGNILKKEGAFYYPWDSLNMIGKVKSEDNKLKIFTWYLIRNQKEFEYFGILQLNIEKEKKERIELFLLKDGSANLKDPETVDLSPENWYGALYYGIKTYVYKRKTYYALLGYDFHNAFSDKKLVEVLGFENADIPVFGGSFQMELKKLKRVIFEYSAQVAMTMRYDERLKMIVVDHLSPIEPIFKNNYRFYSPDGSYDGFDFRRGIFILHPDVDARNY